MPDILIAEHLRKEYGAVTAVEDVSFTVQEGEIFGLLGPNGAGKTTTISMLTGLLPPTAGSAWIAGHDVAAEGQAAKRTCGLVPQDLALYPTLSARANLEFFGRIYGLGGSRLRQRVDDVLDIVGLTERANARVDTYSGGMKRRVNIAAGLVHEPKLLFLDEPTVGVDPQSRNHIFQSVQRLNRERGMTVVYTSHYMEEVELLCHRAAIIDRGCIVAMDTIRNLIGMLGGGVIHLGLPEAGDDLLDGLSRLPSVRRAGPLVSPPIEGSSPPAGGAEGSHAATRAPAETTVVQVETIDSRQALVEVIGLLNRRDVPVTSLQILEPNLESVFLHLTGKSLRE
jgi:ABC-2 type transport system ATP-binding protein